jgi:hypothetical protein
LYLAHPVVGDATGLTFEEIAALIKRNLDRASRWLGWIVRHTDDVAIRCSWLGYISALPETPELRERGLRDDDSEAATCTGIVLCGGRLSSGMRRGVKTLLSAQGPHASVLKEIAAQLDHESARYTGDGDPGCVSGCLKCQINRLRVEVTRPRYVLDLLDLGDEPPLQWTAEQSRSVLQARLTFARTNGTNGPTTEQRW